ncbi:MAG: TorF family putative porin [Colwellia polaris]|jgi:uncharacterized protein (TIGR02001 family)|uniref:TorF family putative porin n=1 Tax=Colwellia polaris TaxID=326537 RepID=UPI000A1757C2|nr:TorF family putative porin [Colwellia polaris]|tara:strand:+ start:13660 stop:14304 length:645 start_codon:yes stop_codon:yes gene_type:complete
MKKSIISLSTSIILATSALASTSVSALEVEGLSANVGVVSQYIFRGIVQTDTASASAGVDYENSGFYVGAWAADVQEGLEIDLYGGYGGELDNGLGYSLGFTTYQYTGDFDTSYNEVNLGLSYGMFSVSYNVGEWEVEAGPDQDYDFLSATVEHEGFYATYGTWGKDFDGDYFEVGYGTEVSGFDVGVAVVSNSKELAGTTSDENLVFSIGKSF